MFPKSIVTVEIEKRHRNRLGLCNDLVVDHFHQLDIHT